MEPGPTDADHDPGPIFGPRHGDGNEVGLELEQLQLPELSSGTQSPEPETAAVKSADEQQQQQQPPASNPGLAYQQRKEKGRVRFNSRAGMTAAASGSGDRRPSEGATRPRPSLVRNPNSSNSIVSSEPDPDISDPKKHKSAREAQERAKAIAEDAQRNPLGPDHNDDDDDRLFNWVRGSPPASTVGSDDLEDDHRNGLVPLTILESNQRAGGPSGGSPVDPPTPEQNEQRNFEAQELLMAHGFGAQAQDLQQAISPQTDGVASPRQGVKGPRGGVFYQILQAYRNPDLTFQQMPSLESGLTACDSPSGPQVTVRTPSSSGRQTPRRKWHEKPDNRSVETLATLVGASTKLANPNGKEKTGAEGPPPTSDGKPRRPAHRRKTSGSRIMSMIGARGPEDEARITIHVADILQRQKYLIKMCRALMLFGAPTHRLEEYLSMAANVLEITCQFLYIPGCMIISFDDVLTHTAEVKIVRTQQGVNLGKLKDIHDIYKEVLHDCIGLDDAVMHLDEIISAKDRFPLWVVILTYGFASAVVACFFSARPIDLPPIFVMGTALGFMQLYLAPMSRTYSNVFEIVAAVLLSFIARGLGSIQGGGLFCFSALAQSSIALILPGWLVLCSALELQSKSMVAGSVRMVYAVIYSLFLGYGITVGTALYGAIDPNAASEATCRNPLPSHWNFLFIPLYAFFSTIMVQAKWKQMPVMILIATAGYAVNYWSSQKFSASAPIAYTFGAFTIGVLANLYSRLRHGVAAAALLPAVYCQVPGSLASSGAVTSAICISKSLANNVGSEVCDASNNLVFSVAASMIQIAIGITVGLFLSALIIYPLGKRRSGLWTL
ncbi:hypothetical protein DHEL01_v205712 [Diaporthe helianthi]|uniref:Pheromone-regulated membrane protein 10 n=1 Tax=Diaporthe helianthi TaxID=158607 RepID=A0A2P5I0A9_DIAHE|nr:hypothetical protein DHEL01_v205712 [Diaporthe helianthi]